MQTAQRNSESVENTEKHKQVKVVKTGPLSDEVSLKKLKRNVPEPIYFSRKIKNPTYTRMRTQIGEEAVF